MTERRGKLPGDFVAKLQGLEELYRAESDPIRQSGFGGGPGFTALCHLVIKINADLSGRGRNAFIASSMTGRDGKRPTTF